MADPCKILYVVDCTEKIPHVNELIKDQQLKTFKCGLSNILFQSKSSQVEVMNFPYRVDIRIEDPSLRSVFKKEE